MNSKKFYYKITIKDEHLDSYGHVNNAVYLQLLEMARWDILIQNGYSVESIIESGVAPTILEINLKFSRELRLNQSILIETKVTSVQRKIFILEQQIHRGEEVCCLAQFTMGVFDLNERKLIPAPDEYLHALGVEK